MLVSKALSHYPFTNHFTHTNPTLLLPAHYSWLIIQIFDIIEEVSSSLTIVLYKQQIDISVVVLLHSVIIFVSSYCTSCNICRTASKSVCVFTIWFVRFVARAENRNTITFRKGHPCLDLFSNCHEPQNTLYLPFADSEVNLE